MARSCVVVGFLKSNSLGRELGYKFETIGRSLPNTLGGVNTHLLGNGPTSTVLFAPASPSYTCAVAKVSPFSPKTHLRVALLSESAEGSGERVIGTEHAEKGGSL